MQNSKIKALAQFLSVETSEIEVTQYDDSKFIVNGDEYLVLTDDEADKKCHDYIRDSLWTFNTEFILDHVNDRVEDTAEVSAAITKMKTELCESANEIVYCLIDNLSEFIDDAIRLDGRGHFLAGYDFEENRVDNVDGEDYYIYRTN